MEHPSIAARLSRGPRSAFALVLAAGACAGCSSQETEDPGSRKKSLLDPPSYGVQLRAQGTTVPAGADLEWCEVAEFPGEPGQPYYVKRLDFAKSQYSHHLFVNAVARGSKAEAAASAFGVGKRKPCVTASLEFGEGVYLIGGAAKPLQTTEYPDGVGQVYYGGQKFILDYHYFNTSHETVRADVAVNFHFTSGAQVKKMARAFSVMNLTMQLPPLGTTSVTSECRFNHDVLVGGLVRHTHRWGKKYTVWTVDENGNASELWVSNDWQEDIQKGFSKPMLMKAGTAYRYRCDYQNTEPRTITFGTKATDEMCNLFGAFWVVNEGDQVGAQNCVFASTDPDGIARGTGGDNPLSPTAGG